MEGVRIKQLPRGESFVLNARQATWRSWPHMYGQYVVRVTRCLEPLMLHQRKKKPSNQRAMTHRLG
jgi:uncharacterized circularly permuted ATP-grasp superfamily protein